MKVERVVGKKSGKKVWQDEADKRFTLILTGEFVCIAVFSASVTSTH